MVSQLVKSTTLSQFARPTFWLICATYAFVLSFFTAQFVKQFLTLQQQNMELMTVAGDILAPNFSVALLLSFFVSVLISSFYQPLSFTNGFIRFQRQLPISPQQLKIIDLSCASLQWLVIQLILIICIIPILWGTPLDIGALAVQLFGYVLISWTGFLVLFVTVQHAKHSITSIIVGLLALIIIWLTQWTFLNNSQSLFWLDSINLLNWFSSYRLGVIHYGQLLANTVLILSALVYFFLFSTKRSFELKPTLLWLIVSLIALLLSRSIPGYIDSTSNQRFSILPALSSQLDAMGSPLEFTSFGLDETARHEVERRLLTPLKDKAQFIISHKNQLKTKKDSSHSGIEIVAKDSVIWIDYPFKSHPQALLNNALKRISQQKNSWVGFIEGHGEASLEQEGQRHLSKLKALLVEHGYNLKSVNIKDIANNMSLLVLASPRIAFDEQENQSLLNYLELGGNILWLRDPDDINIVSLEHTLPVTKIDGTLIDGKGYQNGTPHPAVVLLNDLSQNHPLLDNLNTLVAMPWTAGLSLSKSSRWNGSALLPTHKEVWTEWLPDNENIEFNEEQGELKGSFFTLVALERTQGKKQQRILVAGDSHFLSDMAIANYDNQQLASNIFNWLTSPGKENNLTLNKSIDSNLQISPTGRLLIFTIFPIVLPALFLCFALYLWHRAKKDFRR